MLWFCSNLNPLLILSWDSDSGTNPNHASTCKRNITLLQTFSSINKHLYLSQWLLEWQSFLLSSVDSAPFNSTACNTSCRCPALACLWTQATCVVMENLLQMLYLDPRPPSPILIMPVLLKMGHIECFPPHMISSCLPQFKCLLSLTVCTTIPIFYFTHPKAA